MLLPLLLPPALTLPVSSRVVRPPTAMAANTPRLRAAVIIPGFLSDASDFEPLAQSLTARGLPTIVAPMKLWHWLPVIGGRSIRPVLDRIEHAVRHAAALSAEVPSPTYSIADVWSDFWTNPGGVAAVGGSIQPDEYPLHEPCGTFPPPSCAAEGRVALIGHSAGGYMARVFLSERPYAGKAYCGKRLVHSLVTLGTPHMEGKGTSAGPEPESCVSWTRTGVLRQLDPNRSPASAGPETETRRQPSGPLAP